MFCINHCIVATYSVPHWHVLFNSESVLEGQFIQRGSHRARSDTCPQHRGYWARTNTHFQHRGYRAHTNTCSLYVHQLSLIPCICQSLWTVTVTLQLTWAIYSRYVIRPVLADRQSTTSIAYAILQSSVHTQPALGDRYTPTLTQSP